MADHYRILGITKNASKSEIKDAFRKLAVQFHPDKHAQSSKSAKDAVTLKFKQVSEAYEVLIDDRKRAAYNLSRYSSGGSNNFYNNNNSSYNAGYYRRGGTYYRPPPSSSSGANRFATNLDAVFRYMTTRSFLLHLAFAGILLGGTVVIDMSGEALWKMQNPGVFNLKVLKVKSFEEAMKSIERNREED
ncbi:chaperone protein dnaJ 72-like isoform X2 [Chenopodium quinoa]|uniref:chaperone protein dnaJ 72-like isoform X2 n=1 Tax=Chenopodium quinoa TaxID=63459 RepID=UPI000B798B15|nr:chaperone protein dnaJ 72-like isoform X2 [Chenopodium quinoa]